MQFHSGKRNGATLARFGALLGAGVIILVFVFHQYIGAALSGVLTLLSPSKADIYSALPKSTLASRLADREAELSRIKYQAVLYALIAEEKSTLLASLGLPESQVAYRGRVIARPPKTHYDTLLVEIMPESQASVGDYAYTHGFLIGEVVERNPHTVLVSLFSSPGRTFDARLGAPSALVVVEALGGGSFIFEVPKEVSVTVGDSVTYAHGTHSFIAVVQTVLDEPDRTTFLVHAATPISMSDMEVLEFVNALPDSEERQ